MLANAEKNYIGGAQTSEDQGWRVPKYLVKDASVRRTETLTPLNL